jgi:predicted RNA-binding Zn ribbon-like protein
MAAASSNPTDQEFANQTSAEWIDGFLFVGNRPILDLVNTKPVLDEGPTELLPDFHALERWLIASRTVTSARTKNRLRSWRHSPQAEAFRKQLLVFRERLREAILRIESGSSPSDDFLKDLNVRLLSHPLHTALRRVDGHLVREALIEPRKPADLWAPFVNAAAELLSESNATRIRRCEGCVVHFFDTSKKGSRRWCSMNICGNKVKVAAYRRRKRERPSRAKPR